MAEILCPGPLTVESEFQVVPGTPSHGPAQLTGACGPNASSHAARCASHNSTSPDTVTVYRAMRHLNLGDSNGVSNAGDLRATLQSMGYAVIQPNAGEGVQAFCARMAGHAPIVLEIANGQALRDELTGKGEDASNLQYHFVCILGRNPGGASSRTAKSLPAGYWVADGDNDVQNPVVNGARVHRGMNGDLVYYSDTTLAAAQPYSAFAVPMKEAPVANNVPTGWKDDGKTLTAPDGTPIVQGFRDKVLAWPGGWAANNVPLAPQRQVATVEPGGQPGGGVRQDFLYCSLGWRPGWNVYVIGVGRDVLALQAQVAALQAQLAQAPKPDPVKDAALHALQAVKAALGEL